MFALLPVDALRRTNAEQASETVYDAVIVGSGITGSIIANELAAAGKHVLILEAGPGEERSLRSYETYLERFYATAEKGNQAPYPLNLNAPAPGFEEVRKIRPGEPDSSAYLVQDGPFASDTDYTRVLSGTTMHWEAKTPRMLPEDFKMHTNFGRGPDWPIDYAALEPYYRKAEAEIGVAADVEDQRYLGITFPKGYVYPMQGLPLSYLDKAVHRGLKGTSVELDGHTYKLGVRPFPQGRNGIPNKDYQPVGAVSTNPVVVGGRCQGNNACVPLCPIQAKYNAGKTLAKAMQNEKGRVELLTKAVASRVVIDHESGRVTGIEYKLYDDLLAREVPTIRTARARIYAICANAIETSRLMLASGLQSRNGLIGRNFMDHAYLLSWARMPERCGVMRGTNCTGGIVALRGGSFRRQQAAFSVDIHNDGWGWAMGSPYFDVQHLVDNCNKFGRDFRKTLIDHVSSQLLLAFMVDVLPSESNRISVDPAYVDQLGNMRPVLSFALSDYTMRGVAYARQFAKLVFQRLGADDHTFYDPAHFGHVTYAGESYVIRGGNHIAGTHAMGTNRKTSVVDVHQRSWEHDNLYLVGAGSMPTIGTANITLTMSALTFMATEAMKTQLQPVSAATTSAATSRR